MEIILKTNTVILIGIMISIIVGGYIVHSVTSLTRSVAELHNLSPEDVSAIVKKGMNMTLTSSYVDATGTTQTVTTTQGVGTGVPPAETNAQLETRHDAMVTSRKAKHP